MSTIKDGGAAFPGKVCIGHIAGEKDETPVYQHPAGMTLRDYFAAKAIQGQIAYEGMEGCDPEHISKMAYELADAMLKAREVKP